MTSGGFDRLVSIETNSGGTDALGGKTSSWTPVARVWAQFQPVSDAEKWRAGQVEGSSLAWFRVMSTSQVAGITTKDRIVDGDTIWSITGIKEARRRRLIEFTAETRDG